MEKDLAVFCHIREKFGVQDVDIRTYSPLTLAYIGDGIYDLVIRSIVVGKGKYEGQSAPSAHEPSCKSSFTV